MQISLETDTQSKDWDDFVLAHPEGSFFHRYGWQGILQRALKHKTYYFAARRDGQITGLLPLVHIHSRLFGNNLSSIAFGSYGGAIASDQSTKDALEHAARELGEKLGVDSIEYRYMKATANDRPRKDLYERFVKDLLPTEEENMQAIRSKQRNVIRKGIKKGLAIKTDNCDGFYPVYAESVRNLGTPVFPKRLFESMLEVFPENIEVLTAHLDGQPVSSAIVYYFKDEVCPYYWGGKYIARSLAGNDFLAWGIICRAAEKGITKFDFGRSKKDTGSRKWKTNLGFEAEQLNYEYDLIKAPAMPDVNPSNPKYKFFIDTWKKLPLPVANTVGPVLSRNLG